MLQKFIRNLTELLIGIHLHLFVLSKKIYSLCGGIQIEVGFRYSILI
jgi:hypothetical protein